MSCKKIQCVTGILLLHPKYSEKNLILFVGLCYLISFYYNTGLTYSYNLKSRIIFKPNWLAPNKLLEFVMSEAFLSLNYKNKLTFAKFFFHLFDFCSFFVIFFFSN